MADAWTREASVETHDDGERGAPLRQFDRHRSTKAVFDLFQTEARKTPKHLHCYRYMRSCPWIVSAPIRLRARHSAGTISARIIKHGIWPAVALLLLLLESCAIVRRTA